MSLLLIAIIALPASVTVITLGALWFASASAKSSVVTPPSEVVDPVEDRCPSLRRHSKGGPRRCDFLQGHSGPHHAGEDSRYFEWWWTDKESDG